jgi:hypothetical protein
MTHPHPRALPGGVEESRDHSATGDGWMPPLVSPELIAGLNKLATYLTEQGEYEAVDLIDTVVARLTPALAGSGEK